MKFLPVFLSALLIPFTASAALVSLRFDTVIDATPVGGQPATPLSVTISYDSDSPAGTGGEVLTWHGPVAFQVTLGGESASAQGGGGLHVWDDEDETTYQDGLSVHSQDSNFAGLILGRNVSFIRFNLLDMDKTMFSRNPGLPPNADFAAHADYQQTQLYFADNTSLNISEASWLTERTPFTVTTVAVPEPGGMTLLLALCGVMLTQRARGPMVML